ncbi:MAG: ABC transporter ATP-binding protein [Pseudorhodoplanes sp.]|nr:ABC transporter ATP-binding protein [Pseudorhodoplanes sp.]
MPDRQLSDAESAIPGRPPPLVRFASVSRRFGPVTAVDSVSLDIARGEFCALLGPSGCGKTTLLRMLAGFERPDEGRVLLDGEDISDVPPHRRAVNMMFQNYALFPPSHGRGQRGVRAAPGKHARRRDRPRVADMLASLRLDGLEKRKPAQLSGGQRQRVALARALVKRPKVFLLDEPLAALDKKLRSETQFELRELQRKLGMTFIVVTHDQEEAMSMADRIAVMNRGSIVQVAPPRDVYEHPISRWIAEFIGEINLFEGVIDSTGPSGTWVDTPAAGRVHTPNEVPARKGDNAFVAVRPEKVLLAPFDSDPGAYNSASGTLVDVAYLGDTSVCRIKLDRGGFMRATITNARRRGGEPVAPGAHVALRWEPDSALVLVR